jgi:hypothetical protein
MKHGVIFSSAVAATLLAVVAARADSRPDFDEDAKPILRSQPGLVEFVRSHYQVKETGLAKYPGDDDRRPAPPYIFFARPAGSGGPYNLRLLIQPGPPGHILGVVDANKVHGAPPPGSAPYTGEGAMPPPAPGGSPYTGEAAPRPAAPPQYPTLSGPAPSNPAYTGEAPGSSSHAPATSSTPRTSSSAASPSAPTADTPSGPIDAPEPSSNGQPALAPPADPAPGSQ